MLLLGTVMGLTAQNLKARKRTWQGAPTAVNGTVPPRRVENAKRRPREYLTVKEVERAIAGARERSRYGHRDATMIFVAYRHGLRVSELSTLRWDQVDFERGLLHVRRVKNGTAGGASLSLAPYCTGRALTAASTASCGTSSAMD